MGKELLHTYPVYAEAMAKADLHLKQLGAPWSLLTELHKDQNDSRINEASISQPCCTAIQIALVDLLKVWNIRPQAVCGHSSGEIAAAYAAGFISAEDALKISYYRGQSVANLKLKPKLDGIMLAAGLSASKALEYISRATPRSPLSKAVVACINSNASVTISGDRNAIQKVQSLLEADGIFNRLLVVDVAYHSHHMELVQDDYLTALNGVRPIKSDSQIHMVSSVTGKEIGSDSLDAGYWVRNMLSPVRFSEALEGAVCMSTSATDHPLADIILEIGPHSALAGPIKQVLHAQGHNHSKIWYNSVLSRNANAVASALDMAGGLFSRGVSINFNAVNDPIDAAKRNVLTDLPTYSWQHTMSHWHESRASIQYRLRKFARHDLLGVPCHDSLSIEPTWRISLRLSEMPWLKGHVLDNQVIFPAAGHICMALEALRQTVLGQGRMWKNLICRFRNVVIDRALLIPDNTSGVETFFSLRQYAPSFREAASNWKEFRIFSMSEKAEAVEHCRGLVCVEDLGTTNVIEGERENLRETDLLRSTFQEAQRNCRKIVDPARFYNDLREIGISYTDSFASLTQIRSRPLASLCTIEIPDTKVSMPAEYEQSHFMHPATLDTCFQAVFPAMMEANLVSSSFVLTAIEAMEFSSDLSSVAGTRLLAYSTVEPFGRSKFWTEVTVGNPDLTQPSLVRIKGLQFTSMDAQSNSAEEWDEYKLCHVFDWSLDTASATSQDLYQLCHTGLSETSARERREAYDCYCQFIMQKVLSTIKSEDDVSTQPHLRKFFQWIRANSVSIAKVADPALRNRVASLGIEGRTLVHVGDHLVEILKGEVEPLTVLMKDDLLYQVYSAEEVERCNIQLANYVRQLQFKNPQMRILEIGAGTAGTTLSVLAALTTDCYGNRVTPDKVQEYVFTDISSGFFEKAKDKLGLFGELVKFKKLDIEQPPSEQGFVEGSFDLIIASNVLHATQSLTKTLHNVCRLLKPGGKLGLIEVTAPQVLWPMIMGTLPGWWLGADDGRVSSPLINVSGWNEALRRSGFSGVDAALKDYEVDYEHQVSLIISTATPKRKTSQIQQVRILVDDNSRNVANAFQSLIGTSAGGSIIQQDCVQASISSEAIYVVLLEVVQSFLASCTASEFLKIKEVLLQSKGVLWVTKGAAIESESPQKAVITGLSRTIRSEDPTSNILTLDLDPSNDDPTYMAQQILKVYNQAFGPHSKEFLNEFEYAVRDGKVLIPRICADRNIGDYIRRSVGEQKMQIASLAQPGRALGLEIETPGLLESFYWADSKHHSRPPTANEVQVQMGMFALNFKDVMNAMGQLEGLSEMLIESSGVVVKVGEEVQDRFRIGDRVCALGTKGLATFSNLDYHLVQRIPDDMPLELASSILVSYATALYALRDMAHLNKGESVLIHSGAGALGQAAIALAQYMNAGDIFVTVSSAEKKDLIMQRFRIPEENIYSSRSLSFGSGIRRQTDGKGVDVIINSLSGDAARESQTCLAQFGRFIEVGKKDLLSNARMETRYLEKNSVFAAVDLTMVALHRPLEMQALLKTVIDLVHTRAVQTLGPITVMSVTELENAFRLMQKGRHIGKIVLKLDEHAQVRVCTNSQLNGYC
jgi:emericellamide synthase (highly reducing iterative type I polyketide synthase)